MSTIFYKSNDTKLYRYKYCVLVVVILLLIQLYRFVFFLFEKVFARSFVAPYRKVLYLGLMCRRGQMKLSQ
jgi:hypothetical protein